jgi:hypothetical protein
MGLVSNRFSVFSFILFFCLPLRVLRKGVFSFAMRMMRRRRAIVRPFGSFVHLFCFVSFRFVHLFFNSGLASLTHSRDRFSLLVSCPAELVFDGSVCLMGLDRSVGWCGTDKLVWELGRERVGYTLARRAVRARGLVRAFTFLLYILTITTMGHGARVSCSCVSCFVFCVCAPSGGDRSRAYRHRTYSLKKNRESIERGSGLALGGALFDSLTHLNRPRPALTSLGSGRRWPSTSW